MSLPLTAAALSQVSDASTPSLVRDMDASSDLSSLATTVDSHSPKRKRVKLSKHLAVNDATTTIDRKVYLKAGLYSRSYKTGKYPAASTSRSRGIKIEVKDGVPLFPQPLFHGEELLNEERDFSLPFDILEDFDSSRGGCIREVVDERSGKVRKPIPYKKLQTNMYTERWKETSQLPAICHCTEGDCGDECINRQMQYFCNKKTCPRGEDCDNVPFTFLEGVPEASGSEPGLKVFWTGNRGFGLKTTTPIEKGEFVIEYRGEIITRNEAYRRVLDEKFYKNQNDYYFLDYDGWEVIDAGKKGNVARFCNHSCGPNLEVVRWRLSDLEEFQFGLFALRDIDAGEELCYDYGWQSFSSIKGSSSEKEAVEASAAEEKAKVTEQPCLCGAQNCRGLLGAKKPGILPKDSKATKIRRALKEAKQALGKGGKDKTVAKTKVTSPGKPNPKSVKASTVKKVVDKLRKKS